MRFPNRRQHAEARRRAPLLLIALALVLIIPGSASAASFTAHLQAPNHSPIANKPWPITVTATRGGAKLSGSVRYQFVYAGQVVASRPGHSIIHGVCHDSLKFTSDSISIQLTLRVIVTTKFGTVDIPWAVKTRK